MKKCNKLFAVLLCVIALFAVFSLTVSADTLNTSATISATEVKVGDTLTMTVSISETTVSSMGVSVTVDDGFEIVSGEWLKEGLIVSYDASKDKGAFAYVSATATSGEIFKVTLKATTANASAQNVSVQVIAKNGATTVFDETVTKSVKIACQTHTFGDYITTDAEHARTCTACGLEEKAAHAWDNGTITTAATCDKEGVKTYTCGVCDLSKTEVVDKIAHTWDNGVVTTAATCDNEGVKTYTCAGCNETKTETLEKLAHTYTNDCDDSCNSCGATRSVAHKYADEWTTNDGNHWVECSVCGDVKDKAAHTESDWIVDKNAGELTAGSRHTECTVCQMVIKTESIAATGCKHGDTTTANAKAPTCDEDGYSGDKVCKTCEEVLEEGTVLKATGHDTELVDVKEATCTEEGFTGNTVCKVCDEVIEKGSSIEKTAHKYVDGVCTECDATDPNHKPITPEKPADPDDDVPETGDGIVVAILTMLAVVGIACLAVIARRKRATM